MKRVDVAVELEAARCRHLQHRGGTCIPASLRGQLDAEAVVHGGPVAFGGLGMGRTGGSLLNFALAACNRIDLFGAGMYSDGPGMDVLYQHYYDSSFAHNCSHECITPRQRADLYGSAETARFICRPDRACQDAGRFGTNSPLLSANSEDPEDFFFRSELRLYVLHALGAVNWVWYTTTRQTRRMAQSAPSGQTGSWHVSPGRWVRHNKVCIMLVCGCV